MAGTIATNALMKRPFLNGFWSGSLTHPQPAAAPPRFRSWRLGRPWRSAWPGQKRPHAERADRQADVAAPLEREHMSVILDRLDNAQAAL
jgi:hypothetical protein